MHHAYSSLVAVVEHGTLVAAAAALHLTQPTLTRQIQQLEAGLGTPLFDRAGKRLSLTPAGEIVYRYAKQFLQLEFRMTDDLNAFANPEEGTVLIGAGLTPSIYFLPAILAAYRNLHKGVRFQVTTASSRETLQLLWQRAIDVGIVTTLPEPHAGLVVTPLVPDELLLVAPPNHPLATAAEVRLADLHGLPFILMREGSGLRKLVLDLIRAHHIQLGTVVETDSLESISRLVQLGMGVAVVPTSAVQDDEQAGRLVRVALTDVELGSRTLMLLTRELPVMSAVAANFARFVPAYLNSNGVSQNVLP